jgi:hypothetical protein
MSVSFGGSRPGPEELIKFAQKANEIEIGGISDLADDMGTRTRLILELVRKVPLVLLSQLMEVEEVVSVKIWNS